MIWFKEIARNEEGSALATVLIISVIISVFIGAIFSGILLQSRFIQQDINSFKALYAAEEGAYRFLNEYFTTESFENHKRIVLSNETEVKLTAIPFGGFIDITSEVTISNQVRTIRMLTGDLKNKVFEHAIALGDSNSALTVAGMTEIKGDILTYATGVKAENFKGIPFRGSMDGEQFSFTDSLRFPKINTSIFEIQENEYAALFENQRLTRFSGKYEGRGTDLKIQQGDTLYFDENSEWVSNQGVVHFPMDLTIVVDGNFTLNGEYSFSPFTKIIVRDTLIIGGSVTGKQVLFFAGESLQIGGASSISAQVLSSGTVTIRDEAYLVYPSLVYSSKRMFEGGEREVVSIKDKSVIDGTIVYPYETNSFNQDLFRVKVDTDAIVRGGIYNAGQTELLGSVLGSVVTHQFYFYESPTSYINWLKDIVIDMSQRPQNFVLPIGISDSAKYKVVDWYEFEE